MPVAWFLCPYKLRTGGGREGRYAAMDDFTAQINADNGNGGVQYWSEVEVIGDYAIVKVRASAATLSAIDAAPGFVGITAARLNDPLSSLTTAQKNRIRTVLNNLGYTNQDITSALGNDIGAVTLGQLLRFVVSRPRKKPRFDTNGQIVLDGPDQPMRPLEEADATVA